MKLLYFSARVALAWVFVRAGVEVARHPAPRAKAARAFIQKVRSVSPVPLPHDIAIVRANAVTHVLGGAALVWGRRPRLAAAVLVASLVPTSLGGHDYWHYQPPARAGQRVNFDKNVGLLGGLLLVLLGGGRPSRRRRAAAAG
jgi:putative oxidoreductase